MSLTHPVNQTTVSPGSPAQTPSRASVPFIVPSTPPPSRPEPVQLPEPGSWVRVVSVDGGYTGKVLLATADRIRLQEGAGFWDLAVADVLSVAPAERPARPALAPERRAALQRQFHANQLRRILDRWP
jgi:hypothetical protein